MDELLRRREVEFLLYEFLDTESLLQRPRYREHSRGVFDATIELAEQIADSHFAPSYQKGDVHEPTFDGRKVHTIDEAAASWNAVRAAGFLKAHCDFDEGGLQLPEVILRTAMAHFMVANGPLTSYAFLTLGVINLIRSFGTDDQKRRYLPQLLEGEFAGTMALTEPNQGSALADVRTRADLQLDGSYRIFGQKIFITAGDHEVTSNIVHMVLAKVAGSAPGAKGISLFLVPKHLVRDDGGIGQPNDVALAGLLHKMGQRSAISAVLNFGEKDGAVGFLVGDVGKGLTCMFQMMNEARIGVGLNAASIATRGYRYSLDYARNRIQGRLPSNKDQGTPQVSLIQHADVRRMLLAQKAYSEGALALCLYASSLFEDERSHPNESMRRRAATLLSLLTPVVKSWSSKYGCASNDLAIQVLGGAGYIREHPVEQLYRDQRLNPIHEGTEGIHGIDLLGRKVGLEQGAGLTYLRDEVEKVIAGARNLPGLDAPAKTLDDHFRLLEQTTVMLLAAARDDIDLALANATLYLDVFGRVVVAWLWLRQAVVAAEKLKQGVDGSEDFYRGKMQTARWYLDWELPSVVPACKLLSSLNKVPYQMQDAWF